MGSQQLTFDGDLELIDVGGGDPDGFTIEAVAGTRFGNPVPVESVVASFLRDGSIVSKTGDENREMSVLVRISGPDGVALALGEKRLNLATGKRTTLAWTPPDGLGPTTVFDVLTSSLERVEDDWDLDEVRGVRTYSLRIVALPFGRSVDLTTEVAEGIPSVGTVIDDGTSTSGWSSRAVASWWTAPPGAMVSVDAGRIAVQPWAGSTFSNASGSFHRYNYTVTRTLSESIDMGAYVSVEVGLESGHDPAGDAGLVSVTMSSPEHGSQVVLRSAMILEVVAPGVVRYTWRVDEALTLTALTFAAYQYRPSAEDVAPYPYLFLDDLAVAESATLGNQVLKTITVGGSARSTGALHVAAPSDSVALGSVLAYTVPQSRVVAGWRPDLAQWVEPGATTNTVGGRAGVFTDISTAYDWADAPVFTVPASLLRSGAYTVAGLLYRADTSLSFSVEASLLLGSTVVASQELEVVKTVTAATWGMQVLGTMYLPPQLILLASADATVRFRFKGTSAPVLDDLFVFPVEGDLTIIECGSGTVGPGASSHLWLDSPSPDQPQGGYWRGTDPTREDALSAWSSTVVPGVHSFEAGEMLAFAASSEAQGPTVTFDYRKSWFGNAAE